MGLALLIEKGIPPGPMFAVIDVDSAAGYDRTA
jgi:hypothetical protein